MTTEPRPPRAAERLAAWLLAPRDAERLADDLGEEYAQLRRRGAGRAAADLWYWRQVLRSVRPLRAAARRHGHLREGRGGDMGPESWLREAGFALRRLRASPTFTLTATLTLALGIGATTAIFSVVQAVLLRSLPYDEPERIVRAWAHTDDGDITDFSFRVVEYRGLREHTDVFERVGAEFPASYTVLVEGEEPQQVQGRMVSADLFRVFGVEPALGRMFTREEVDAADRLIAVVSHAFWSRFLGADPAAVGRTIDVSGNPFEVVGVLPPEYRHVSGGDAHVFVPFTLGTERWIAHWLHLYLRLQPGVEPTLAADRINGTLRSIGESDGRSAGWHATVESLHEMVVGDVRPVVWAVFAMVGVVLLLACVNVANLTLARSTARTGELAVRRALGAGRGALMRQLLVENLLLAGAGGLLGTAVALGTLRVVVGLAPSSIPRIDQTALDPSVLAFSLVVTLGTVFVFGLGPALRATRAHAPMSRERAGTGGRGLHGALGGLVVSEVALTLALLTAAGLTLRTMLNLRGEELGFEAGGALTFRVSVPSTRYPTGADTYAFYRRLFEELERLPGVRDVGAASDLPVSGQGAVASVTSEERLAAGLDEPLTALQRRATVGLFGALGTEVVDGREFDDSDRADGPTVAIVSESLARALFADGRAVGRRVAFGRTPSEGDWMTVVGVVADVRYEEIERDPDPQIYQAHAQSAVRQMAVVVRTDGDPMALLDPARTAVHQLDPQVPLYSVTTLGGLVDLALSGRRFTVTLFGLFAGVALALTLAGLYGVLAFAVGQRRREIGVRIALGARSTEIAGLVVGRGLKLIAPGVALGLAGAFAAGRMLESLLYGVAPFDPLTFGVTSALLVMVGAAACVVPARGATRVDPVSTLKDD